MKRLHICLIAVIALTSLPLRAETIYVTDQLTVTLHAEPLSTSPIVKSLPSGAALELIEQGNGFAHVRDAQGTEGWIEAASVSQRPPATVQVKGLRAELERTRSQLTQLQAQLDKAKVTSTASIGDGQGQAELAAVQLQLAQAQEELKKKDEQLARKAAATATQADSRESQADDSGFSFLWLGIAFAMLLVGFVGGIVWVRESIRRRMGGMYLRI